jgi:hypothetical protein
VLIFLHALSTRQGVRARRIGLGVSVWLGLYLALLLAFSFVSREQALAPGEEKYFCEIDCHLAYSVANVRKAKTLGSGPDEASAGGLFYVVTVRTRFDQTTISNGRDDSPLTPNSRIVNIRDEHGNTYNASAEGQRALERSQGIGAALNTALRPGESYTTELVFDLPADTKAPALLIREGGMETRFIIGHENSFFHGKTTLRLES